MSLRGFWKSKGIANRLLLPASWAFFLGASIRRLAYAGGLVRARRMPVPVVVIGGIVAGGGGKTPFTIALARQLREKGFHPGVISRGYGGKFRGAVLVEPGSSPERLGDEAVLIRREAGVPVCVCKRRADAAVLLLASYPRTDVIVCDDGLQHLALQRDLEIAMVDPEYGLGNEWLLPAGPLRETPERLKQADIVVGTPDSTASIRVTEARLMPLRESADGNGIVPENLEGAVAGVAGVANPDRFFDALERAGIKLASRHPFPDHHRFRRADIQGIRADRIVMTPKDAVKCRDFADDRCLEWKVAHAVDDGTVERIAQLIHGPESA